MSCISKRLFLLPQGMLNLLLQCLGQLPNVNGVVLTPGGGQDPLHVLVLHISVIFILRSVDVRQLPPHSVQDGLRRAGVPLLTP